MFVIKDRKKREMSKSLSTFNATKNEDEEDCYGLLYCLKELQTMGNQA